MAPNLDGSDKKDILKHGQALYRGKNYKAAVQCFNTVCPHDHLKPLVGNMKLGCIQPRWFSLYGP